jgi:hypothetical protein
MTKRQINSLIYLIGCRIAGYVVVTNGYDGCLDLPVPSTHVGNAIVRALREQARLRPDLFPPSKWRQS